MHWIHAIRRTFFIKSENFPHFRICRFISQTSTHTHTHTWNWICSSINTVCGQVDGSIASGRINFRDRDKSLSNQFEAYRIANLLHISYITIIFLYWMPVLLAPFLHLHLSRKALASVYFVIIVVVGFMPLSFYLRHFGGFRSNVENSRFLPASNPPLHHLIHLISHILQTHMSTHTYANGFKIIPRKPFAAQKYALLDPSLLAASWMFFVRHIRL